VNVLSAIEQGTTEGLPVLKDGDTIVILSTRETYIGSFGVTVVGAVLKPGFYRLQGEHRDLMSAVTAAGGLDRRASLGDVKIIRQLESGETITMKVNFSDYLKNGNPEANPGLLPGDTVSVTEQNAWAYQLKNNFGIIISVVATVATVILVIDRVNE
jgi:protein involved in polysaccharide export with SLBB domain